MTARLLLLIAIVAGLFAGQTLSCVAAERCACCPAPSESSCCSTSEAPAEPAPLATFGADWKLAFSASVATLLPHEARELSRSPIAGAKLLCFSPQTRRALLCIRLI